MSSEMEMHVCKLYVRFLGVGISRNRKYISLCAKVSIVLCGR
jgi:hypothetical protein